MSRVTSPTRQYILEVRIGCTRKILNQRSFHSRPLIPTEVMDADAGLGDHVENPAFCDNITQERLKDENPISIPRPDAGGRRRGCGDRRRTLSRGNVQPDDMPKQGRSQPLRTRRPLVDRRYAARSGPAAVRLQFGLRPDEPATAGPRLAAAPAQGRDGRLTTRRPRGLASSSRRAVGAQRNRRAVDRDPSAPVDRRSASADRRSPRWRPAVAPVQSAQ